MVKWSFPAKSDLKSVHSYIAQDSEYYAQVVIQNILHRSKQLNQFNQIGRIVPEINDYNIRELLIYSYRLIYKILPDEIIILTLISDRRLLNRDLLNNLI